MKRSHVFAGVMVSLVGSMGASGAFAAAPDLTTTRPSLTAWAAQESRLIAQNSSSNLSAAQQEQLDELLRQGQARVAANDPAGAIAAYQQAAQIDPQNARIFSGIGYLHIQQGNYTEAVTAYRRAVALDRGNLAFRYGLAHSLFHSDQPTEALATYREILASHPREANAYLGIGSIQLQQGDNDAALATYQELVRLAPGNAQAYEALGNLYIQQEDYDQALTYLNRGVRASSSNKDSLYVSIASLYLLQENFPAARSAATQALALNSTNAQAQNQMGYILYQEGDRESAFEHLVRAVRLNPDLIAAHALLGELLLEREQFLQAVLSYRRVVDARPDDPAAFYNLGLALWGQGLQAQAVSNVELARYMYERQGNTEGAERAVALINFWGIER
ncbi:MAG: tetratricopeptide repeat protein [Spirulina sp.]